MREGGGRENERRRKRGGGRVRTSSLDLDGALFQSQTGLVIITHIIELVGWKRPGTTSVEVWVPSLTWKERNSHHNCYVFLLQSDKAVNMCKNKNLTYSTAIVPALIN